MKFRGGEFLTGTTGNFQPELTHPSLDKSAPSKKVAAKVFILQGGAEPFSSAPVWAEPVSCLSECGFLTSTGPRPHFDRPVSPN
jgi:hypothetical protein